MALLPKSYLNSTRIKRFQYNGIDLFEANYREKNSGINAKCYHKHKGTANQTSANGCYQKRVQYGGSCPGHTVTTHWNCGWCGTQVSSYKLPPSECPNNVCGSKTGGQKWYSAKTTTEKHTKASDCDSWNWQIRYDLSCGYDADDGK